MFLPSFAFHLGSATAVVSASVSALQRINFELDLSRLAHLPSLIPLFLPATGRASREAARQI